MTASARAQAQSNVLIEVLLLVRVWWPRHGSTNQTSDPARRITRLPAAMLRPAYARRNSFRDPR
jgi:hypothetical protein